MELIYLYVLLKQSFCWLNYLNSAYALLLVKVISEFFTYMQSVLKSLLNFMSFDS